MDWENWSSRPHIMMTWRKGMKSYVRITILAAMCVIGSPANAQREAYPSKAIHLIVPYSAGSGVDLLARSFGRSLSKQLNIPIVVENREGATGTIGTLAVARAPADGYTIMINANPPFTVAPISQKTPPYDVLTSFAPLARVGSVPLVLITAADSPARSFAQLRDHANANPQKATYASTGNGSPGQLNMELIKSMVGMKISEIPYKSSAQALTDVTGGHILASLVALPAAEQLIVRGRLRALAIGSKARLGRLQEVPTLAETLGSPGLEASVWYGFLAPADVAPERMKILFEAISKAFASDEAKESMNTLAIVPELLPPAEFAAALRKDSESARKMLSLVESSKPAN